MSEEEARKTWCPYAIVLQPTGGSGNRDPGGEPVAGSRCLGSRCQKWVKDTSNPKLGRCADVVA